MFVNLKTTEKSPLNGLSVDLSQGWHILCGIGIKQTSAEIFTVHRNRPDSTVIIGTVVIYASFTVAAAGIDRVFHSEAAFNSTLRH